MLPDKGGDVRHMPHCALAVRPLHDWQNLDGTLPTKVVRDVSFTFASWLIVAKCLLQRVSEREK